jgi:hypothetical protein
MIKVERVQSKQYKYNSKTNHCCCDFSEYGGGEDMRGLLPNPENPDISEGVAVSGDASNADAFPSPGVCGWLPRVVGCGISSSTLRSKANSDLELFERVRCSHRTGLCRGSLCYHQSPDCQRYFGLYACTSLVPPGFYGVTAYLGFREKFDIRVSPTLARFPRRP